ncbi:MAG: NAD(P)-dependent oxidoreductase [Acetobacteraceae bacterium]
MSQPFLVIGFDLNPGLRAVVAEVVAAEVAYLTDLDAGARAAALRRATVLLARNTDNDLHAGEAALLANARLVQFMTAGVDYIKLSALPPGVAVASNGGAYAAPMAEHALAMAFAASKRLLVEHANLGRGAFNQSARNRMLAGGVCGIFGFGGIGQATARLARGIGMRVHAINRRGVADEAVDWMDTPERLDELLAASDVLVICAPLTKATRNLIGATGLARMKDDAILVNLARGEIIEEAALYAHLRAHPRFTACLDAWWVEPVRHGQFRVDHPFLELPNVIGSPHNSAQGGPRDAGLRAALANCRRALAGETPLHLIGAAERMR